MLAAISSSGADCAFSRPHREHATAAFFQADSVFRRISIEGTRAALTTLSIILRAKRSVSCCPDIEPEKLTIIRELHSLVELLDAERTRRQAARNMNAARIVLVDRQHKMILVAPSLRRLILKGKKEGKDDYLVAAIVRNCDHSSADW